MKIKLQFAACILLAFVLPSSNARAQAWWSSIQYGAPEIHENYLPTPSIATSFPNNADPSGLRKWYGQRGIIFGLEYTNDVLANVHGGTRRGTIDQGKLQGIVSVDLGRLAGWSGLTFFTSVLQLHNTGRIRRDLVGSINSVAAIEAIPATRLSEVWFEQILAGGSASIRIGQLGVDNEFFYSGLNAFMLHSDWPTIAAMNLPSGGAAYPLTAPGARLRLQAAKNVWLKFAVLNGDPAGPDVDDPELRNRHGLNFRMTDPPFVIGEMEWQHNTGKTDAGLATTLKLGWWGHAGTFDDKRIARNGSLLANPIGSGIALQHRGSDGFYAILDQQLYRPSGGDSQSGISVYTRASISPSDRNVIDRHLDGGIVFAGLIPQRPDDRFGFSFIYARFSDAIRAFERDQNAFGIPTVIQDHELSLELNYTAQIIPGWTIAPIAAFIQHPNGDATRNARVIGVRSLARF